MLAASPAVDRTVVAGRSAVVLVSADGRVTATVVPDLAMLVTSLTFDGLEFLGRPNTVEAFASGWATTGAPLLHPWANRLSGPRLAGSDRPTVDTSSPLVPTDEAGLAIHGVNLADAGWAETVAGDDGRVAVTGAMRFDDDARTALFPFPHELAVSAALAGHELRIDTTVTADAGTPVPISFGWHPYLRIPGVPREEWHVSLPVRRRAILDGRMIPTGRDEAVASSAGPLGAATYDDLFTELEPGPVFRLAGGGHGVDVAFGPGYALAQVYAPAGRDLIAFEPMTAPVNALVSGDGLRWLRPGESFAATFSIAVGRRPLT